MKRTAIIIFWILILAAMPWVGGCQAPRASPKIEIHDIQGCAHSSPLLGQQVKNVTGIVTTKLEDGFVIQSDKPDDQFCSSEAIFVFTTRNSGVATGDRVTISGTVSEFTPGKANEYNLSQTELTNATVQLLNSGETLPSEVLLGEDGYPFPQKEIEDDEMRIFDPESDGLDYYESLEWMRVKLPSMKVVGPRNSFNEIVVAENSGGKESSSRAEAALVEDGSSLHPERLMIALPENWNRKINLGDELQSGLIGMMSYSYGNYKVTPVSQLKIASFQGDKSYTSTINGNKLRIAIYNLNNYSQYSTNNKNKVIAGQIANDLLSPDLLVLQEVMDDSGSLDDGTTTASENLSLLAGEIRNAGGAEYQYYDVPPANNSSGGISGGNIRTVYLLNKASPLKLKSMAGETDQNVNLEILSDGTVSLTPNPGVIGIGEQGFQNSRKPIVGVFDYEGQQVVVLGLHFVSKSLNSPLYGSQQPILQPELEQRLAEAQYVNAWVTDLHEKSPQTFIIVGGDLNDGFGSQVLEALVGNILVDPSTSIESQDRFSLINDGLAAQFDHILLSKNIPEAGFKIYHLNTINDENSQVSDHDPVVVSIPLK